MLSRTLISKRHIRLKASISNSSARLDLALRAVARTELHNKQSSRNKVIAINTRVSRCIACANIYRSKNPSGNRTMQQLVEDARFSRCVYSAKIFRFASLHGRSRCPITLKCQIALNFKSSTSALCISINKNNCARPIVVGNEFITIWIKVWNACFASWSFTNCRGVSVQQLCIFNNWHFMIATARYIDRDDVENWWWKFVRRRNSKTEVTQGTESRDCVKFCTLIWNIRNCYIFIGLTRFYISHSDVDIIGAIRWFQPRLNNLINWDSRREHLVAVKDSGEDKFKIRLPSRRCETIVSRAEGRVSFANPARRVLC